MERRHGGDLWLDHGKKSQYCRETPRSQGAPEVVRQRKQTYKKGRARRVGDTINALKCTLCGKLPYTVNDSKAGTKALCYECLRKMYSHMTDPEFDSFLERQEETADRLREKRRRVKESIENGFKEIVE